MKRTRLLPAFICAAVVISIAALCYFPVPQSSFNKNMMTSLPEIQYIHFSIDDCNKIFEDLTINSEKYKDAFDQEILGFIKQLHDRYGVVFSLYVFYDWDLEQDGFDLSMATDQYKSDFASNSDWLKFGFHAADAAAYERQDPAETLEYYNRTIQELSRIVGDKSLDSFVRLDRYVASSDVLAALTNANYPLTGLLIADRSDVATRSSYALTNKERKLCYDQDWYVDAISLSYTPTDLRAEAIENDTDFYHQLNELSSQYNLIVFSHEAMMYDESVRRYLLWLSQFSFEYHIPSDFPQNDLK